MAQKGVPCSKVFSALSGVRLVLQILPHLNILLTCLKKPHCIKYTN